MTRVVSLDIFRIIICVLVFLFHAGTHKILPLTSPQNSVLSTNILLGAIYMDTFFSLSGFLLFMKYGEHFINEFNKNKLFSFYKKRLLRIYPQYIIYTIIIIIWDKHFDFSIFIAQLLLLQGFFLSFFNIMGNGGTWFISCIMILYVIFPFLCIFVKNSKHTIFNIFLISSLAFILNMIIINKNINFFNLYINPLYRILPFLSGMFIAEYCKKYTFNKHFNIYIPVFIVIYIYIYTNKFIYGVQLSNKYTLYSFMVIPMSCFAIYTLYQLKINMNHHIVNIINIISNITFSFYIYQGLALRLSKTLVKNHIFIFINNTLLFFIINSILAIISYLLIEKFLYSKLKKLI